MKKTTINCCNISKGFLSEGNYTSIIQSVSIELFENDIVAIIGPSGSGKTTLISMMSSILKPDKGEILIKGNDIRGMNDLELAQFRSKEIGFMFQSFHLFPTLTVAENIALPLLFRSDLTKQSVSSWLIKLGLQARANELPQRLSGGEQQWVAFARMMIGNPKIIFCDEPTSSLDPVSGLNVLRMLKTTAQELGITVIIVSHDMRVLQFANRIFKISGGFVREVENIEEERTRF